MPFYRLGEQYENDNENNPVCISSYIEIAYNITHHYCCKILWSFKTRIMAQCNEMVPDDDLITFSKQLFQARLMFDGEQASLEAILQTGAIRAPKPIKVFQLLHIQ